MQQLGTLRSQFIKLDLPIDMLPASLHQTPVYLNGRLRRAFGMYREKRFGGILFERTIELQPAALKLVDLHRKVIAHEAAHAVAGADEAHSRVWQAWCLKLGGDGKVMLTHEEVAAVLERPTLKLVGRCGTCGWEFMRTRALPRGLIYRHNGCPGHIVAVRG
jgi:hypothetical protein